MCQHGFSQRLHWQWHAAFRFGADSDISAVPRLRGGSSHFSQGLAGLYIRTYHVVVGRAIRPNRAKQQMFGICG